MEVTFVQRGTTSRRRLCWVDFHWFVLNLQTRGELIIEMTEGEGNQRTQTDKQSEVHAGTARGQTTVTETRGSENKDVDPTLILDRSDSRFGDVSQHQQQHLKNLRLCL